MLSNAYFLAKFRFDTAENEPAKNLQKFAKFCKILPILPIVREPAADLLAQVLHLARERLRLLRDLLPHAPGGRLLGLDAVGAHGEPEVLVIPP